MTTPQLLIGVGMKRALEPPAQPSRPQSYREREQEAADQRLLTLHLLLQTLAGSRLTIERGDDSSIEGTLVSADDEMNLELSDAILRPPPSSTIGDAPQWTQRQDSIRVAGAEILYVHLPDDADAPELLRSRLRAIDQGRTQFRKRVTKQPKPKPVERFAPLVSEHVTEAHEEV